MASFFVLLNCGGPVVGSAHADSLIDAVQEALSTHPELGAIRFNRRAIDNELNAARGLRLPTVDVRSDLGKQRHSYEDGDGGGETHDWWGQQTVGTVVSQRLFDGFEARHEIARQKNRVESARWRVADTANSIALRAVQAYLEVMRAHAVLGAAQSNHAQHRSLLSRVKERADAGKANDAEASEAGARAANSAVLLAEAETRARDADAIFREAVGRPPGQLEPVAVPQGSLPPSVEAAVSEAVEVAPSVIATAHDTVAAEAAVGSAYSRLFPRVNLEGGADHAWGLSESSDRDIEARAMVVVRWNLFNGGIDKSRIWEAKARAYEAAEINANTRRIVERETRISWSSMEGAARRVPELKRQLSLNRKRRELYYSQFDAGQRRLLDLLDVQSEVFLSESALRTEELVGAFSTFRVLAGMGKLVPALGLYMPAEAAEPPAENLIQGWRTEINAWPRETYHDRERIAEPAK
jgi:adhesin transport system outer membrane protein